MKRFSLENKPHGLTAMRKKGITDIARVTEPFEIDTQEGITTISPETVDDWDNGYCVAYPADGTKPYSIAPKYVRDNYEFV